MFVILFVDGMSETLPILKTPNLVNVRCVNCSAQLGCVNAKLDSSIYKCAICDISLRLRFEMEVMHFEIQYVANCDPKLA